MFKKVVTFIIVLTLVLGIFTGCTSGNNNTASNNDISKTSKDEPVIEQRPIVAIKVLGNGGNNTKFYENPDNVNFIKEKFGIVFQYEWGPADRKPFREVALTKFASGEVADYIFFNLSEDDTLKLGMEGQLLPINKYVDKLPNYRALFTDEEWEYFILDNMDDKENVYFLPPKEIELSSGSNTLIYRKSTFDKLGLIWPKTTDEFYEVLKTIKQETGVTPAYVGGSSEDENAKIVERILAPSFRTRRSFILDPDLNYDIAFGPATDKYRDALRFARKLVKEDLFLGVKYEKVNEAVATGNVHVLQSGPNGADSLTVSMKKIDPEVQWEVCDFLQGYPGKAPTPDAQEPYGSYGPMIYGKIAPDKLERLLEFLDWTSTKEGIIWTNFGLENKSFTYENGKVKWMPHIKNDRNPDGKDDAYKYALTGLHEVRTMAPSEWTVYEKTPLERFNEMMRKYDYIQQIRAFVTPAEDEILSGYTDAMNDIKDEYIVKYLSGELDETAWDQYIQNIKRAGLDEATKLYKEVYEKTKKIQQSRN